MAVVGLGTDLVESARFRRYLDDGNTAILERLFTEAERAYALARRDPAPHLAARFAAKEACLKAFGTGLRGGVRWQEIEVVSDDLGCPRLALRGRAADMAAARHVSHIRLSYSHDGGYAVATVLLEAL